MIDDTYEIRFSGDVVDAADVELVKTRMAALFKVDRHKIERLFSGRTIVLKRGLDAETAIKYRAALHKIGAVAQLVTSASEPQSGTASAPTASVQPPTDPQMTLAEPGALLAEPRSQPAADIDIEAISMAEVGIDLIDHEEIPEPEIDISPLSMAPVGSDLADPAPRREPEIDISELTAAPPGERLSEAAKPAAPDIDISGLDAE